MSTVGIARRGIVKFIVLASVNPSALDDFRSPATARVVKMTELDPILKLMLGIGGNPNASAKWQLGRQFGTWTPPHAVAFQELLEDGTGNGNLRSLLNSGTDINTKGSCGYTPLVLAIKTGHEKRARELLEFGADLTAVDSNGSAALALAVKYGFPNMVKLLCDYGAFPDTVISAEHNLLSCLM
ncbi:ankyrin repeat-containing domain protein [Ilyonectria destructans]|nr:ankyrin repeat-containing domain protein [Ilyonectria destructans]